MCFYKNKFYRLLACGLLLTILVSALSGCVYIKSGEAKEITENFFDALKEGNYEKAESYFHPAVFTEGQAQKGELEQYINLARQSGIDFKGGYEILHYSSFETKASISEATYEHTIEVQTSGIVFTVELSFFRDQADFGITFFRINLNEEK